MTCRSDFSGIAALSICEAILLSLRERKILSDHEIAGLLHDAAAVHTNAAGYNPKDEEHHVVADQINQVLKNMNLLTSGN